MSIGTLWVLSATVSQALPSLLPGVEEILD